MIEVTMFDVQVPPRQLWITPCWSCWRCCSARGRACPPPAPTRRTSPCWSPPARQRHYITKAGKEPSRSFHDHISYSIMDQPASEGRSVCGVDSAGYSSRLRTWTNNIAFIYPRSSSKGTWLCTYIFKEKHKYLCSRVKYFYPARMCHQAWNCSRGWRRGGRCDLMETSVGHWWLSAIT